MTHDEQKPVREALKGCPFCGGVAKASNSRFAEGKTPWPTDLWHVGCDVCMVHFRGGSNVDIAASRWNTRAATTREVELLAVIRAMDKRFSDISAKAELASKIALSAGITGSSEGFTMLEKLADDGCHLAEQVV
jgi:hypothetical protein